MKSIPLVTIQRQPRIFTGFLFFAMVLSFILALAFLMAIEPNDYWWYMRVAREMLATGTIPTVDHLSYTQAGTPLTYQTWLASLVFLGTYQAGGVLLTGLLRGLLVGVFYLFVWLNLREAGAGPKLAALTLLLAALTGSNNWAMRPQLFAYPLFAISLWALSAWQRGENRRLWLLPALAALWINLHASYPLLFLLVGAALLVGKGDRRRLLLAAGLSLAATCLNPKGPAEWGHTLELMRNPAIIQFSKEWQPPVNTGWQMNLFFTWLLACVPLAVFAAKKFSVLEWLWFLSLGWMALSGLRYGIWFTVLLALLSARALAGWANRTIDRPGSFSRPVPNLALGTALLLLPLALLPGLRQTWWQAAPPDLSPNTPVAAAAWLAERPELPGPLWSELIFSSYLAYALPERPVWVFTQFEIFRPDQLQRYQEISQAAWNWEALLQQEGIRLLLLSRNDQAELVRAVQAAPAWAEVYGDPVAVIFVWRSQGGP